MTLLVEERLSDSSYIETVMQGQSIAAGSAIRPAETHWHMVFVRADGQIHPLVVGAVEQRGGCRVGRRGRDFVGQI